MKYAMSALAAATMLAAGANANPGNGKNAMSAAAHSAAAKDRGSEGAIEPGEAAHGNGKSAMAAGMKDNRGPPAKAARVPAATDKPAAPGNMNANANRNSNTSKDHGSNEARGPALAARASERNPNARAGPPTADVRVLADGRHVYDRPGVRQLWNGREERGLIDGCPPGLAKKHDGCLPPGLATTVEPRYRYTAFPPDWWGLGSLATGGGRYRYADGYLLRLDGNRVGGYIPLLGGALSIGNPWPMPYAPHPVPDYYVDYYDLGPSGGYRYADDVLYRVDPKSAGITSIAALLSGDDIRVGEPMPPGYDVYNVPRPYRAQYADGPDRSYRYSDGYIYQVDPKTQIVAAAIELLAG
ncbi:hypothetical protein [Croceibacterium aestuarii]|uniref:hypothetical protein n=1 Tax=Croceibacterium aestuarii TaxID=3064139 RepID=UPI00272E41E8|nr:hypothetical protein [Croceibacterium sp. D39]